MQFAASQKLLNPDQMDAKNQRMTTTTSNFKYVICFTGNNDNFTQAMVHNFFNELKACCKDEFVILCEPLEEFAQTLKKSINDGEISDINTLTSKAAETLKVKHKLLQESLQSIKKTGEYLIINSMVNAEDIILIQEKYGVAPIIIEIFDANLFRQLEQPPWKSIRSSMRLSVNKKSDIPILYRSLIDYLFKALNINTDYKNVFQKQYVHIAKEFDRLALCSPILFDGCYKMIRPTDSIIETYMPKTPKEIEESYMSTSEEHIDSDLDEEHTDSE